MTGYYAIGLLIALGMVLAVIMRARQTSRATPVLEAVAQRHNGRIQRSVIGMPQLFVQVDGHELRITLMNNSTSSAEGGGDITVVDFDASAYGVRDLRVRERYAHLRNAVPAGLQGCTELDLGVPDFDERFHTCAVDVEEARRILNRPGLISAFIDSPRGTDVRIQAGTCYVSVDGHPDNAQAVERLMGFSERLIASFKTGQ